MQRKDAQDTAERVRQAALRILEREGPAAVSMRRVAQAVGITPMAIYHHYSNRQALLDRVADREFEKLLAYIQSPRGRGSAKNRLIRMMEGYVDYAFAQPRIFDYVFTSVRPGARRYPRDFRERRSPTLNVVADQIAELMNEKSLKSGDPWEIALTVWAHVHGFLMLHRAGRFQLSESQFRALLRRSIGRLIHGLEA